MRILLAALLFMVVASFAQSAAADKSMGAGVWLQAGNPGEHAGLDFQMRMGPDVVIDIYGHLYFSSGDNSAGAYFGYYWNIYLGMIPQNLGRMGFYAGPVGGIGWWDEDLTSDWDTGGIAIRLGVTGGYEWEFPVVPLQLYLELNPVAEFHYVWWEIHGHDDSDTEWEIPDFYFRLGLRFWFL